MKIPVLCASFLLYQLTLSIPGKLKNLIFGILIVLQTLNINNKRTTSTCSINLNIIRKFIEYSLKDACLKIVSNLIIFEIFLFDGRPVLAPTKWGTGSKRVRFSVKNHTDVRRLLKLLETLLTYEVRKFEWLLPFLNFVYPYSIGKIVKLNFWDFNNSKNFKHQENDKCKVKQPGHHKEAY